MAKYAQGYARKNSDTKNLIILFSSIIAVIVLVIVFAILYNKFWKREKPTYASAQYAEHYTKDYTNLLNQSEGNYIIYICSSGQTTDANMNKVLAYLDSYTDEKTNVKMYLLDYDSFDSTSDTTETANAAQIETELGFKPSMGYLIAVQDNKLTNKSTQVLSDNANVIEKLDILIDNGKWLNFNN